MRKVWAGSISSDEPRAILQDIELWASDSALQSPFAQDARLHFLSVIHVPSIPLYLAVGPSIDVSTDNESTAASLSELLFPIQEHDGRDDASQESWWANTGVQSDQGILVKVVDNVPAMNGRREITEVLLYAAAEARSPSLPTPPGSSSPAPSSELVRSSQVESRSIKVHALPLSSSIIDHATRFADAVTPPPEDPPNPVRPCFLPDDWNSLKAEVSHQKRQSLSSLFDNATQKRRKLKGRGGESFAQAMANIDRSPSQSGLSIETRGDSLERSNKPSHAVRDRRTLSRADSSTSAAALEYTRPTSRSGASVSAKRSSLHGVESAISPRDSPTLLDVDDSYSEQNKAALTKVVMAGMRLYGLQQKKTHDETQAAESSSRALKEQNLGDEYKFVYHQTFKAATFAFRRQSSALLIPQETMRDVVDQLLNLFCNDPLASTFCANGNEPGFGTQGPDNMRTFDLPSTKNALEAAPQTWKTLNVTKR